MLSLKLQHEVALAAQKHYQLEPHEVEVALTRDLGHGDYTTNVALKVASKWGVPPKEAAQTLLDELKTSRVIARYAAKVELAGPGFINFTLKPEVLLHELAAVSNGEVTPVFKGKRVIVEYSSPNIAKPMHIGHLRSTIIGQAVANIYQTLGAKVIRLNHLGDWGTQFGKLISAFKMWGSRSAVHRHPIEELLKLYVKFHEVLKEQPDLERRGQEEFKKLEEGDRKNRALWQWFRTESLREFDVLYKRLGVKFTHVTGESFYEKMLPGVVADFLKRKLAVKNTDGSVVVHLEGEGLPPALIQKSDGVSLYATRDLAAIRYRVQHYKPQAILYVVGNEQALHFEQVFAAARHAGYAPHHLELLHLKNGLVLGEDGLKLATREGKIIKLDDVLQEAVTRARAIVDKKNNKLAPKVRAQVAEVVGVGALKYNDLSQNRHTDITFNWDKMLSFEGNSGPYLQYTYVRLKSILRKAKSAKVRVAKTFKPSVLTSLAQSDVQMLRLTVRYPEAVLRAARENGPHLLAQYLYELATATNSYYHDSPVLSAKEPVRSFRLYLVSTVAGVLKHGLSVLGIGVVEQM